MCVAPWRSSAPLPSCTQNPKPASQPTSSLLTSPRNEKNAATPTRNTSRNPKPPSQNAKTAPARHLRSDCRPARHSGARKRERRSVAEQKNVLLKHFFVMPQKAESHLEHPPPRDRATVGQGPSGPGWLAASVWFGSGRALATGTAWAGLCLINHHP